MTPLFVAVASLAAGQPRPPQSLTGMWRGMAWQGPGAKGAELIALTPLLLRKLKAEWQGFT